MPDIKQYDARPGKGFIQYTVRWREQAFYNRCRIGCSRQQTLDSIDSKCQVGCPIIYRVVDAKQHR